MPRKGRKGRMKKKNVEERKSASEDSKVDEQSDSSEENVVVNLPPNLSPPRSY